MFDLMMPYPHVPNARERECFRKGYCILFNSWDYITPLERLRDSMLGFQVRGKLEKGFSQLPDVDEKLIDESSPRENG